MAQYLVPILAAAAAAMTPAVFVAIRASVKTQRQETIRDLETMFGPATGGGTSPIPSLEFVKYKYYLKSSAPNETPATRDFRLVTWLAGAAPLTIVMLLLNTVVFATIAREAFGITYAWGSFLGDASPMPMYAWVVVAAYCGAYLFMIRAFFTAIHNFDLSPGSFVGAFVNLVCGVAVALILVFGVMSILPFGTASQPPALALPVVLVAAFTFGYTPSVALRYLKTSGPLEDYKKDNVSLYKTFTAVPVEVIDGIDSDIRDRLEDFHINAVQNLAAANPLMLFVETPYGVYQILDWVAQAQLCCSVGPAILLTLWQLGIRTIFDLERAALDPACIDSTMLALIGKALFGDAVVIDEKCIIANIRLRLNDSHVHRLRQIYNKIGEKLGNDSRRLPPIFDCPADATKPCPFVGKMAA